MYNDQQGQAAIYFGLWDLTLPPNDVGAELARAPGNGIYGELVYTTWADGNDFDFSSVYAAGAGEGTFGSVYDPTVGGLQAAAISLAPAAPGGP